jgi:hypothetical protein
MNESDWVDIMKERISGTCIGRSDAISVHIGMKLPYGYEIRDYPGLPDAKDIKPRGKSIKYETDLLILESSDADDSWKPRLIVECKVNSITTHDAITYSQKAATHKFVHPYLRYGVILGNRRNLPLPGRLYRHGMFFDFMMSFESFQPTEGEMTRLKKVIKEEIKASKNLEHIIYDSRKKDKAKYTLLHRKLELEC